ncbi:MAG TPA: ATP-binding protein [Anaerolineae bacterium]|nr:ATP-binding protein [Anaerolineae bacterium]
MVSGDPARIEQIINNLLSNAIKFTPENGEVRIQARSLQLTGRVAHWSSGDRLPGVEETLPDGDWVVVTISDTGIGIAPEELPRLFNRFQRSAEATRRAIRGTGLGLHIARKLVEAHGGFIGAQSQLGQGSTFWVALPARREV